MGLEVHHRRTTLAAHSCCNVRGRDFHDGATNAVGDLRHGHPLALMAERSLGAKLAVAHVADESRVQIDCERKPLTFRAEPLDRLERDASG